MAISFRKKLLWGIYQAQYQEFSHRRTCLYSLMSWAWHRCRFGPAWDLAGPHQVFCAQVFMLLFASIITRSLLSGSQRCRFMHVRTCSCVSPASAWRARSVSDFNIVSKETLSLAQLSRYNNILNNVVTLINIIGHRLL